MSKSKPQDVPAENPSVTTPEQVAPIDIPPEKTTKVLTAAEIFAAEDRQLEAVEVPEWGGTVFLRPLNGEERDSLEKLWKVRGEGNTKESRAILVSFTACDQNGERIFSLNDVAALQRKNSFALNRLFTRSLHQNGMTEEAVKSLAKNS